MGGHLRVDTEELHGAATTLGRVDEALSQKGDLNMGAGDCGSPELASAIADFCQRAGDVATMFSTAVGMAAARLHGAGTSYATTEQGTAKSFQGPR